MCAVWGAPRRLVACALRERKTLRLPLPCTCRQLSCDVMQRPFPSTGLMDSPHYTPRPRNLQASGRIFSSGLLVFHFDHLIDAAELLYKLVGAELSVGEPLQKRGHLGRAAVEGIAGGHHQSAGQAAVGGNVLLVNGPAFLLNVLQAFLRVLQVFLILGFLLGRGLAS